MKILIVILFLITHPAWSQIRGGGVTTPRLNPQEKNSFIEGMYSSDMAYENVYNNAIELANISIDQIESIMFKNGEIWSIEKYLTEIKKITEAAGLTRWPLGNMEENNYIEGFELKNKTFWQTGTRYDGMEIFENLENIPGNKISQLPSFNLANFANRETIEAMEMGSEGAYNYTNNAKISFGIEGGGYVLPHHPIIRQYRDSLKQYGDGEFFIHEKSTNANDNNIYRNFIDVNRDMINQEDLKKLMDHWQTDLTSPAKFQRYRNLNTQNLNWEMVQEDIDNSLELLDMSGILHIEVDHYNNTLAYRYDNRIYLNPYRDIAEVWLTDNTYFDVSEMRESLESPAMIDLDINHIQSIILEDGREIFMDNPDTLKELSIRPASNNIDWKLE